MFAAALVTLFLGAGPPVKQALVPYKFTSVEVPEWTVGYYTWSWLAQKSTGSKSANMGVQFSGEIDVTAALKAVGALTLPCDDVQKSWCDGQLEFYANAGKSPEEARMTLMQEFTDACRSCLITPEDASEAWAHPFSLKSGMYNGAQYLSLGGGRSEAAFTPEALSGLVEGSKDIEAIKDAGFAGVCFDVEEAHGSAEDLISAFERSFIALKQAGLRVMVTTSHSAPYETDSDETRVALVDSWVRSDNIDYISPQLYSDGQETKPEYEAEDFNRNVDYKRYRNSKAKFVPSIASADQIDAVKAYFQLKGITVAGYVQWKQESEGGDSKKGSDDCVAHGICARGEKRAASSLASARAESEAHARLRLEAEARLRIEAKHVGMVDASDCVSYESLVDDSDANFMGMNGTEWCRTNCAVGFCPEDRCKCLTASDVARIKKEAAEEAKKPKISDAELKKIMHTELPREIASKISGPWFYVCDGTGSEPTGAQRNELYGKGLGSKVVDGNKVPDLAGRQVPDWLASASRSGNAISLAFMDPTELLNPGHGVPNAFAEYTHLLRNGTENRDRQIFFAIGGIAFTGFDWLQSTENAEKAGEAACEVAREHNVGIEIDHESSRGNDVEGLRSFLTGFRRKCPMGKYPVSIDLMGSPGGGGLPWAADAVKELVPEGAPGDPPPPGGPYLDFVNVMVIGGCADSACLTGFWSQWKDFATLNFKRAAFTFEAGGVGGICDKKDHAPVKEAWAWLKKQDAYGLRAWSVTPAGGGEWDTACDAMGAPGLQAMCAEVGLCDQPK